MYIYVKLWMEYGQRMGTRCTWCETSAILTHASDGTQGCCPLVCNVLFSQASRRYAQAFAYLTKMGLQRQVTNLYVAKDLLGLHAEIVRS